VWEYKSELFVVLGNIICMILSALVPSPSIIYLYFVSSVIARLAVVFGMSFLLSFVMTVVVQGCRSGSVCRSNGFRSCTSRICWIISTGVGVADLTIGGLTNHSAKAGGCRILAFIPASSLELEGDEIRIIIREISHIFLFD
jgi:hypothetical protein